MNNYLQAKLAAVKIRFRAIGAALLDTETYSNATLFKLSVALIGLLFWKPLVAFYVRGFVGPVLSQIPSTRISDFVFGVIALILGLLIAARARLAYRPGLLQVAAFTVPGFLYLVLLAHGSSLAGTRWHFTRFHTFTWLRYADVLVVTLVGAGVLGSFARRQARRQPTSVAAGGYLQEDTPEAGGDTLSRGKEAKRLVDQLTALRPSASFAVGVVGQWGSGKTRFLNLMEQHLPAEAIVIRFNPWLVESTAAIRKEFFTTLKDGLGHYSGGLAAEMSTYANGLAEVYDSTAAKVFKEAVSFLSDTPTLTEQFAKVNEVIGRLNRPIFVFLDDIDRLDKDEVLETLRIVRNTASFRRTVFVLAYDRQYVLEAVSRTNQANSSQYLDKIVQLEISLPDFSPAVLARRTLELILPAVDAVYHAELRTLVGGRAELPPARNFREMMTTQMQQDYSRICYYPELVTNMRSAVRFANLFLFDFLPLAGEVRLDELLNLTLLKLRFPALYDAIKTKHVAEADLTKAFSSGGTVITLNKAKLTSFYAENTMSSTDQAISELVVEHLFGKEKLTSSERTIQRPSTFGIYFSAGNFANVSLVTVAKLRTGPPADIDRYLDQWQQADQLLEAFEVLTSIDTFNDRADFENVVTASLRAGRRLNQDVLRWLMMLNAERASLAKLFYSNDETALATWLAGLLAAAPSPYLFEAGLVGSLRAEYRHNSSFSFLLSDAQLGELALQFFLAYLAAHSQIDQTMFELHWATICTTDERNWVVTDERANTAFRQALQNISINDFPLLLVPYDGPSNVQHWVFRPLLMRIFGSWSEFETFLQQLPASPEATSIQHDFFRFKAANYEPFNRA